MFAVKCTVVAQHTIDLSPTQCSSSGERKSSPEDLIIVPHAQIISKSLNHSLLATRTKNIHSLELKLSPIPRHYVFTVPIVNTALFHFLLMLDLTRRTSGMNSRIEECMICCNFIYLFIFSLFWFMLPLPPEHHRMLLHPSNLEHTCKHSCPSVVSVEISC